VATNPRVTAGDRDTLEGISSAARLKLELFEHGLALPPATLAILDEVGRARPLTPADYASTSGLILRLDGVEWVNAPIVAYNPNFVSESPFSLQVEGTGFTVVGPAGSVTAELWVPPQYHGERGPTGRPWNHMIFTHGDRARLAPVGGCAMTCKFCNIPYEDQYWLKPVALLVEAVRHALDDPVQPAHHLLISGGTPRMTDVPQLRETYRQVLQSFPDLHIDIMMVPVPGLLDPVELRDLGLNELSINLEIYDRDLARSVMPHKFRQGVDTYLAFIEEAAESLGQERVRSMLLVGLEPPETTLAGVQAVLDSGATPVLSPFRPDPATPFRDRPVPDADSLGAVYAAAADLARKAGVLLGPSCTPCTHNTLTLARDTAEAHGTPVLV
jgi:hypothetical protein